MVTVPKAGLDQESVAELAGVALDAATAEVVVVGAVPTAGAINNGSLGRFSLGRHGTPGLNSGGSADSFGPASTPHLLETGSAILLRVRGDNPLLCASVVGVEVDEFGSRMLESDLAGLFHCSVAAGV